ncbi:MAG: DUF1015 family protein, partial [Oscillospiraceae bacterium]|nr:DUF1015 family protein [Oscillospiraceae bacterium]
GNHSLASAKRYWEQRKAGLSADEAKNDPARYALVELVNLHSDALRFEPVHRLVKGTDLNEITESFRVFLKERGMDLAGGGDLRFVSGKEELAFAVENRGQRLPVSVLQEFLDDFTASRDGIVLDYIHGDADLRELSSSDGAVGILLCALDKYSLFPGIRAGGHLPRKTFSMGEAREKRYYMECRKIR